MRRAACAAVAVAATVAMGCGSANRDPEDQRSEVEVTGCLTSSGDDRFVLTTLERSDTGTTIAAPATESYLLKGDPRQLRPHVGKQVHVSGMADTPDVAIARGSSPAAPAAPPEAAGTAGQQAGGGPQVKTEEHTRLEIAELTVREVRAAGDSCAP